MQDQRPRAWASRRPLQYYPGMPRAQITHENQGAPLERLHAVGLGQVLQELPLGVLVRPLDFARPSRHRLPVVKLLGDTAQEQKRYSKGDSFAQERYQHFAFGVRELQLPEQMPALHS